MKPNMQSKTLPSDPLASLPVDDRPIRRKGMIIVLLTFGLLGGWAALAPLDSAALAPGVVTVKSYRKTVQHLEGGIVRELRVHDGDQVEAGDILLVLDNTQARAEAEMIRSQLIAAQEQQARLEAERDGLEQPAPVPGLDPDDPRVREARDSEARIFLTRRAALQGEIGMQQRTIGQIKEQITGYRAVIVQKERLARSYESEVGDLRGLLKDGYVDKQRLTDQERSLTRTIAEVAEHKAESARAQQQMAEAQLKILQLNKTFATEVAGQLGETRTRIYDLRERLSAVQDRDRRTEVLAPDSGMVMGLTVHTLGGVISPGTPLMDIVPANEELIVEAQISPTDIDRIIIGAPVSIRFSAFKSSTTPVIEGQLQQISADRLINKDTGNAYYLGRITVTDAGHKALGDLALLPGMPAEVLVNTGARTLLQYLAQPASNTFARSLIED